MGGRSLSHAGMAGRGSCRQLAAFVIAFIAAAGAPTAHAAGARKPSPAAAAVTLRCSNMPCSRAGHYQVASLQAFIPHELPVAPHVSTRTPSVFTCVMVRCGGSLSQAAPSTDGPTIPSDTPAATAAPVTAASQRHWQQADHSAGAEKAVKRRYAGPDSHRLRASRHRWDVEVPSPQRSLLPAEGWVVRPRTYNEVDPWGVASMYMPALGLPACSRRSLVQSVQRRAAATVQAAFCCSVQTLR